MVGRIMAAVCGVKKEIPVIMAEQDWNTNEENAVESRRTTKKPYQEPAFRHERVFETMALSCGKVQPTQFQCRHHRNAS
jgi:hypothetical protein